MNGGPTQSPDLVAVVYTTLALVAAAAELAPELAQEVKRLRAELAVARQVAAVRGDQLRKAQAFVERLGGACSRTSRPTTPWSTTSRSPAPTFAGSPMTDREFDKMTEDLTALVLGLVKKHQALAPAERALELAKLVAFTTITSGYLEETGCSPKDLAGLRDASRDIAADVVQLLKASVVRQ